MDQINKFLEVIEETDRVDKEIVKKYNVHSEYIEMLENLMKTSKDNFYVIVKNMNPN